MIAILAPLVSSDEPFLRFHLHFVYFLRRSQSLYLCAHTKFEYQPTDLIELHFYLRLLM